MAKDNLERRIEHLEQVVKELRESLASVGPELERMRALSAQSVPPIIKTEEGRYFSTMMIRLMEALVNGKPITAVPTRHNP